MTLPRIVVVGGGAGGLELVTRLGKKLGKAKKAEIVLVDRDSTHVWKPLYHELATGVLNSNLDEVSFQGHASNHHYRFQRGSLTALDRENRTITLAEHYDEEGELILPERKVEYDYLVLALGSVANDFNTEGVAEHCYFIDTADEAVEFQHKMLNSFLRYNGAGRRPQRKLTVTIIGGGATGVELAAELHKVSGMLKNYGYTDLGESEVEVRLLEAAPRILPPLPERVSKAVHKDLADLGVHIHVDTAVAKATPDGLYTKDGDFIESDLHVWAAGIKAPDFLSELGLSCQKNNQVNVKETMQSIDDEKIFALGDCAYCPQGEDSAVPPRAQAAHQQAKAMAYSLQGLLQGKALKPFTYKDKGSLITLSSYDAVGNLLGSKKGIFIDGWLARFFYASLYRMHQVTIHGVTKTALTMIADSFTYYLKPRMKLH
ncbi:FAD-dependent oxidoreductase [Aliidiomarina minuta]|uniref:FAD-dependent oxidoreductase n=1 Tax=Aliidiomarina minuta TaxID=880057 RepID=A0A432W7B4_9GAMM|nr:NAD(P)/FAD-dependent oxidoreductase [Aliidiomarina minuta]RUO25974.1 FAD-dependent oxidoreductase [Aliidiomarina minuta]